MGPPQHDADGLGFAANLYVVLTSCRLDEFAVGEDFVEVLGDVLGCRLEQLGNLRLGEPQGVSVEATLDASAAVLGLVEDELGGAGWRIECSRDGGSELTAELGKQLLLLGRRLLLSPLPLGNQGLAHMGAVGQGLLAQALLLAIARKPFTKLQHWSCL